MGKHWLKALTTLPKKRNLINGMYRSPHNFISQPLIGIFNLSEERAHHLAEPLDLTLCFPDPKDPNRSDTIPASCFRLPAITQ